MKKKILLFLSAILLSPSFAWAVNWLEVGAAGGAAAATGMLLYLRMNFRSQMEESKRNSLFLADLSLSVGVYGFRAAALYYIFNKGSLPKIALRQSFLANNILQIITSGYQLLAGQAFSPLGDFFEKRLFSK